jgi:hypothetical protein
MTAHTPGPWVENGSLVEADGVVVAHVMDEPGHFGNVRLIAAAPRLLWAARRAELHLSIADRKCYDGGNCNECLGCSARLAFEEIQKAIADAGSGPL